jgi:hypothetical protein
LSLDEVQARIAGLAEIAREKSRNRREEMRAKHPEWAAKVDEFRASAIGGVHAVTVGEVRYGPAPLEPKRGWK